MSKIKDDSDKIEKDIETTNQKLKDVLYNSLDAQFKKLRKVNEEIKKIALDLQKQSE